eukprot:CAMPEP_0185251514 /NCGR_PEP_ID=MMETSP1359-20130426/900_1 /TAXON_ID=552665 /ORGANISM="Bigelowiella longifila, Strain CCMP242" /LENGTH=67 /DNA_ID=CAMNT_0027833433 /DNA_START=311 /DNA_END=514 /DNA_ORIENTATION=-
MTRRAGEQRVVPVEDLVKIASVIPNGSMAGVRFAPVFVMNMFAAGRRHRDCAPSTTPQLVDVVRCDV